MREGAMAKMVMKWLVLMMIVVLAILVQVVVQAENPCIFYLSLNHHPSSLTLFLPSLTIVSLSLHIMMQNLNLEEESFKENKYSQEKRNPGINMKREWL